MSTPTEPSRRETLLFAVATAVIVAHVLADSFVVLEPGARRADHLAAGLVPVIVGGVAIWLYPRLRPGFRATLGIFFGSLALVGAGIALPHAVDRGPRGDDWTGLLLIQQASPWSRSGSHSSGDRAGAKATATYAAH